MYWAAQTSLRAASWGRGWGVNLPGGIVLWWVLTGQAQEGTAPEAEAPQVLLSARVLGGLPGAAVSPGWRWEDDCFFVPTSCGASCY